MKPNSSANQSVQGVLFSPDRSQVLLVKRRDIPVWVLPGGGLDPTETPEEGAIREVFEETGYRVEVTRKVGEYLPVNWMTRLTHLFECRILSGQPQITDETLGISFFPLTQLPPMPPPFPSWIADAAQQDPHLIRKPIEGVTNWVLIKLFLAHPLWVGKYLVNKLVSSRSPSDPS